MLEGPVTGSSTKGLTHRKKQMRNITGENWNSAEVDFACEFDLTAAAAVLATRGDNVVVTKTGTGTYTAVFKGTDGLKLYEVLGHGPSIRAATINGNVQTVQVTSIVQGGGTYNDDITVSLTTKTNAAAAADTTSALTVCLWFAVRHHRMTNPF